MDKKQIDYAKLNQERIITIADLINDDQGADNYVI